MTTPDSDNTKIAVISKTLEFIQRDISAINVTMQGLAGVYETKEEAIQRGKIFDDRLTKIEGSNKIRSFVIPIITFITGSILVFLLINYLQHLK